MKARVSALLLILVMLLPGTSAWSNDRKFSYLYETSVLPFGARELEVWNTYRSNRGYYFRQLDQRVEFEIGLGGSVMSAFYLNHSWLLQDGNGAAPGGDAVTQSEVSLSSEWKFKLLDRVADPVGVGFYVEGTLGLDEFELEGKLLLDKQIGRWLLAANLVGEQEHVSQLVEGQTVSSNELSAELDLGASYEIHTRLSAGVEFRTHNLYADGGLEYSALFAGPVISYSGDSWWATLTLMPQITSLKGATSGNLVLSDHEKVEGRLLFSFHL